MKISEQLEQLPKDDIHYSFEFFPPKTTIGLDNLTVRMKRMSKTMFPLFSSVTWSSAGSSAAESLALCASLQSKFGVTSCLHMTCSNVDKESIKKNLDQAKAYGIRNILALRGDPPLKTEHWNAQKFEMEHAVDLVRFIREEYGDYFCIGVAAYPEGHADTNVPELQQNVDKDIPYLIEKVRAGADFIITQIFYDSAVYIDFVKKLRTHESGVFKTIPIIPAIMPVQSLTTLRRMARLCNCVIPHDLMQSLEEVRTDDEKVKAIGVKHVAQMIKDILKNTDTRGFHFCTLNLEKSVARILNESGLYERRLTALKAVVNNQKENVADVHNRVVIPKKDHLPSAFEGLYIRADDKQFTRTAEFFEKQASISVSEGTGALGREATWDDYTNGRFGDPRSPAYGNIDGYGPSLHFAPEESLKLWGYPVDEDDITNIFKRHVLGETTAIPWIDQPVEAETKTIGDKLAKLIEKKWWTVGSQPAVNAAPSSHAIFGWGPRGGWVFQKAFVEMFMSTMDFEALAQRLHDNPQITYLAGNNKGEFKTNASLDSANAVTWGVFPGREIIQSTIIAPVSFQAWRDEAYSIWGEWARLYPAGTPSHKLIQSCIDNCWLVSVIHHNFLDENALWEVLGC
ncbi:methylenetetrahydrofolate reductase Met11 [Schizosaccharomyces japonicus yFS275]|uniref:Methylenetetrahydrofolate reductase Met11 n=1 Tax=Schizosaccharomyces japonicus (strain yFS275 / FY16936) TaxID=402676 RepID=B6JY06_SCHJY|nr:methylenetetrahydrofolate reductase Met11 [Schizosaccharomyces japonicus yFS275]EEB06424.1 methylenetetrahydrofolate reductase Met11 [Schizosaccharomyces japonicus yFS275]